MPYVVVLRRLELAQERSRLLSQRRLCGFKMLNEATLPEDNVFTPADMTSRHLQQGFTYFHSSLVSKTLMAVEQ
jgi:hypothetical protein